MLQIKPIHPFLGNSLVTQNALFRWPTSEVQIKRRRFVADFVAFRFGQIAYRIAHAAPDLRVCRKVAAHIEEHPLTVTVSGLEMCSLRRENGSRISEFAAKNESSIAGLRDTVIGRTENSRSQLEAHIFGGVRNLFKFRRTEQLRDILHHEDLRAASLHDFEVLPPKMLSRISLLVLIQQAEALTGRPPDYYIRLRDDRLRVGKQIYDVSGNAVIAEVGIVCRRRVVVEVVRPNRKEEMSERFGESERHAARAAKQINCAQTFAVGYTCPF